MRRHGAGIATPSWGTGGIIRRPAGSGAGRRLPACGDGMLHPLSRPLLPHRAGRSSPPRPHALVHRPRWRPCRLHSLGLAARPLAPGASAARHAAFFVAREGVARLGHAAVGPAAESFRLCAADQPGVAGIDRPAGEGDPALLAAGAGKRAGRIDRSGERGGRPQSGRGWFFSAPSGGGCVCAAGAAGRAVWRETGGVAAGARRHSGDGTGSHGA